MRDIDDFRLVFDRQSGETHMLAPDLAAVLDELFAGPGDAAAVLGRLQRDRDVEAEGDPLETIGARLAELEQLGLADAIVGP